jgi:hypothetical protein
MDATWDRSMADDDWRKNYDPWPKYQIADDLLGKRRCAELVAGCEKAWRTTRLPLAVADAVEICRMYRQPPPEWLVEAVVSIAVKGMSPFERRRRYQDMQHYLRWETVKDIRGRADEMLARFGDDGGTSWERCYVTASELLANTEASGGEATMKASYEYVQTEIKEGRGSRFLIVGHDIEHPPGGPKPQRKRVG